MKKAVKIAIWLVAVAVAAYGGYYYYFNILNKPVDIAERYDYTDAVRSNVVESVATTGNVDAGDIAELYIEMSQTVKSVHVKAGDAVDVGQLLVEYDITDEMDSLNRKLREAELNLANARLNQQMISIPVSGNELLQYQSDISTAAKNITDAENDLKSMDIKIAQQQLKLEDAKATLDRVSKLYLEAAATQQSLEQAQLAYDSASASLDDLLAQKSAKQDTLNIRHEQKDIATEKLDNALNKLEDEDTKIKYALQSNVIRLSELEIQSIKADIAKLSGQTLSPISGYITELNAVEGGTASKSTAVAKVSDTSKIIVKSDVSEYDAPLLEIGQRVQISTSGLPDEVFDGEITKIAVGAVKKENSSDDEMVVPVEITVSEPGTKLKVGYTVDIEVFIEKRENVISLPVQAIVLDGESKYVYVLNGGVLVKNEVTTGLYGRTTVEIISGVSEGDRVVLNPSEIKEQ